MYRCCWFSPDCRRVTIVLGNGSRNQSKRPSGLNEGRGSKIRVGSRVRQETPEEDLMSYLLKRYEYSNKNEDSSTQTLNDKNKFSSTKMSLALNNPRKLICP